jgi:hypothetical protein
MKSRYIFPLVIILVSLVLCVRQLGEPDVWWQIRTGEFILENGYVPEVDVFSYTYNGDPWFNVKWGTEVIMALVADWFGPESLMLLNWLVLLAIIWFIRSAYEQLIQIIGGDRKAPGPGFFLGLLFFLFAMAYRINARPEMMSHLLTSVYVFLFLWYFNRPGKHILLLIPLQLIWGNLHEAFGVGQVLIIIFLSSLWYRYLFYRKDSKHARKDLFLASIAGVLAIFSVVIHPMGMGMLTKPFDIFGQLGENKFTTELWSFKQGEYWNLAAYLSLLMLSVSGYRWTRKERGKPRWHSLPLFYLIILAAFTYLAASANRNLPFLLIAVTPLFALDLDLWFKPSKSLRIVYLISGVLLYLFVASGQFYERFYPVEKYGLGVDIQSTPIGAANFIKENKLEGNAYVDYFSSSYLLWALQPDFRSYLDLRDLDVFEPQFITNNLLNYTRPTTPTKSGKPLFRFMEDIDQFSYVVMENNDKFVNFHRYMNGLDDYVLSYADPLTSVYIKDNKANSQLIQKYRPMKLQDKFQYYDVMEPAPFNKMISKILAPWYEPVDPDFRHQEYLRVYKMRYMGASPG